MGNGGKSRWAQNRSTSPQTNKQCLSGSVHSQATFVYSSFLPSIFFCTYMLVIPPSPTHPPPIAVIILYCIVPTMLFNLGSSLSPHPHSHSLTCFFALPRFLSHALTEQHVAGRASELTKKKKKKSFVKPIRDLPPLFAAQGQHYSTLSVSVNLCHCPNCPVNVYMKKKVFVHLEENYLF